MALPPAHNNAFLRLPPEILIRIFADVAVYDPKTFFSLGLVCLDWKHFLTCYRKLIVHDIEMQYETDKNAPFVDYSKLKDVDDVDEILPDRLEFNVPLFIDHINNRIPKQFPGDLKNPIHLRKSRCVMEWAIDYIVFPWWIPLCAAKPPSPMLSTMLETLKYDYAEVEIGQIVLLPTLLACTPGDPNNLIVYEAFKSAGISFVNIETQVAPLFMDHLAAIHATHGVEMYQNHLEMIVSNSFSMNIQDIIHYGCWVSPENDIVPHSKRELSYVLETVPWPIIFNNCSVQLKYLKCKMTIDCVMFWQALYDQLMLNTPSLIERKRHHDEYYRIIFNHASTWGLCKSVFDYCLKHYPGGVTEELLIEGLDESARCSNYIDYLIGSGWDESRITQLLKEKAEKDDPYFLENVGANIFDEYPTYKKAFYREVITNGPFSLGYHVYPNWKHSTFKSPMYYFLIAIERMDVEVMTLVVKAHDITHIEDILRECVFRNVCPSRISWFLGMVMEASLLRTQFVDEMIEFAESLNLEEIRDLFLRVQDDEHSMIQAFKKFGAKDDRPWWQIPITEYYPYYNDSW